MLYAPRGSSDIVAFNGSGRAPQAANAAWYADRGIEEIERYTPHAVTVPGDIDAWSQLLRDHGTRSLGHLLQPAISFARDVFAGTERVQSRRRVGSGKGVSVRVNFGGGRTITIKHFNLIPHRRES